jgi:hypothetical protein
VSAVAAANEPALHVRAFDCFKLAEPLAEAAGASCVAGPKPPEFEARGGIREWNQGGPEGSAWNASDLSCRAVFETNRASKLELVLKAGRGELGRVMLAARPGEYFCDFPLREAAWTAELDPADARPLRTAVFRVEASAVLADPPAVLRADDHFVGAFAWGE